MSKDNKSTYYDQGGIEVLDVIKAKLTPEQYEGYLLGNAIKYALRANWKGSKERDLEKLGNYAGWLDAKTPSHDDATRLCTTCSYTRSSAYIEPCCSCWRGEGDKMNWKAADNANS